MAAAAESVLGRRLADGIMTVPAVLDSGSPWRAFPATHPKPAEASEAAGRAALALADSARQRHGLLLVCLSGGASAMLAVPAAGLTIADKANTTAGLLKAGLDIAEVNVVRRHLSLIKGGQLAARAERCDHARDFRCLHAGRRRSGRDWVGTDRGRFVLV